MRAGSADLHTHSNRSDGCLPPGEVLARAKAVGLAAAAITDHDTVAGLEEAVSAAGDLGIDCIPGIELSVPQGDQELHLLGYWIDPDDAGLGALLREITGSREHRLRAILDRLHALGVRLRFEDVVGPAGASAAIGRPHIARALRVGGWVATIPEAFARFLQVGAPAYVEKSPVELRRAVGVLRGAGGVVVLAHPGAYRLNGVWKRVVASGIQGIEVRHPMHDPGTVAALQRLAARHGLVETGGSDFHGGDVSDVEIGSIRVDVRVVEQLAARRG